MYVVTFQRENDMKHMAVMKINTPSVAKKKKKKQKQQMLLHRTICE